MPLLTHTCPCAMGTDYRLPNDLLPAESTAGCPEVGWSGEPKGPNEKACREKLVSPNLQPGNHWQSCAGRGREEAREGIWEGGGRSEREAGASGESPRSPAHLFIALSPSRRQPGPPLGASSSAPTRPESSGIVFSFPLEIGFGVSPALSPPPRNSSPLFFLLLLLPETWPGQWLLEEEQVWEKGEEIGAK